MTAQFVGRTLSFVAVLPMHTPVLIVAAATQFEVALLVFGGLAVVGALLSGIARDTLLSLTAMFVIVGFVLGAGGFDVLHFDAHSAFVDDLAIIALIVILFRDGLEVEGEMLTEHWHLPLRKLILAMPLTAAIVAVAAHTFTDLSWTESFLLGALLSPTDPVLSSRVVPNPRVPRLVRHSLNLESGLNDGLALPAVLALSAALAVGGGHFVWWRFVLEDVTIGVATGLLVGFVGASLMPRREKRLEGGIPGYQKALYALGIAFATYGLAVLPPHGNGLIAVYIAAITLGIRRPDLRSYFERQSADLVEIVKLGIFVVFGSLLTLHGLFTDGWAAVAIVVVALLVARPAAVFIALTAPRSTSATRAFMAWFGPKGVATMTFSLLVLAPASPPARGSSTSPRWSSSARSSPTGSRTRPARTGSPPCRARVQSARARVGAAGRRPGSVMVVPAAVAVGIHDPAEEDGEQHEGDESADQRPEHGVEPIYAPGASCCRRARPRARRGARPARSPTGTPTRPAAGAPGGTRSASGAAGAGRRDGRAEGRAGACVANRAEEILMKEAVLAARPSLPLSARLPYATPHPVRARRSADDRAASKRTSSPLAQRRIPENARTSRHAEIPANSGNFRTPAEKLPQFP